MYEYIWSEERPAIYGTNERLHGKKPRTSDYNKRAIGPACVSTTTCISVKKAMVLQCPSNDVRRL